MLGNYVCDIYNLWVQRPKLVYKKVEGEMTEWPIVQHWKCCVGEILPWVRIPLSPPPNHPPTNMLSTNIEIINKVETNIM